MTSSSISSGSVTEQCVWPYYRFYVSYRDVEEMMRCVYLTYETVSG